MNEATPPQATPANPDILTAEDSKEMASAALAPTESTHAFEPRSHGQAFRLARMLVASGILPKAIKTPEAAFAIIIKGRELGLTMMQSVSAMHVIDGRVCMSADLMVAIAKRSPNCRYFKMFESTNEKCTCETWREGDPEPTRLSWTIEDAKIAGLLGKDNWKHYPAAMLRARCKSALARAVYEQELMGIMTPDEATDGAERVESITVEADPTPDAKALTPADLSASKTDDAAAAVEAQLAKKKQKKPEAPAAAPSSPTVAEGS